MAGGLAMSRTISEPDWKVFRKFHSIARDRFCERILAEVTRVVSDSTRTIHERYLAVYRLLHERDRELAEAFDDLRRSTALLRLAQIQSHELLTEEEMSHFSTESRNVVQSFLDIWRM
jgi:hypothetical protein